MRRLRTLIAVLGYLAALSISAHAQQVAPQTFGDWIFRGGIDWESVKGAALSVLIGGGLRTLRTLFSAAPTFRVVLEAVGDAGLALVTGAVLYIGIVAWASVSGPVPHAVSFALLVAGGYLRGGLLNAVDDGLKRGLAAATDGAVAWIARRTGAPPQPPPGPPPS